jgi:hypothetical protein
MIAVRVRRAFRRIFLGLAMASLVTICSPALAQTSLLAAAGSAAAPTPKSAPPRPTSDRSSTNAHEQGWTRDQELGLATLVATIIGMAIAVIGIVFTIRTPKLSLRFVYDDAQDVTAINDLLSDEHAAVNPNREPEIGAYIRNGGRVAAKEFDLVFRTKRHTAFGDAVKFVCYSSLVRPSRDDLRELGFHVHRFQYAGPAIEGGGTIALWFRLEGIDAFLEAAKLIPATIPIKWQIGRAAGTFEITFTGDNAAVVQRRHEKNTELLEESRESATGSPTVPSSVGTSSAVAGPPALVPSHGQLFGIETLRTSALESLRSPAGHVIGYHGIGGVGKSALAESVAMEALSENIVYDALVLSSPTQRRRSRATAPGLTFEKCIDRLAERLKTQPSFESIREELALRDFLLFLDNIETSAQPQSELVRSVCDLVAGTKARVILTSRRNFEDPRVQPQELTGLDIDASHELIQHVGKGIPGIDRMTMKDVQDIVEVTGGIPLALNLVVPQLRRNSLKEVVARMRRVDLRGDDEYASFYRDIIDWSWRQVMSEAQSANEPLEILRYLARQPGSASGAADTAAIVAALNKDRASVERARDLLVKFALLEVVIPPDVSVERRFFLHSIVQQYVLALEPK